MYLPGGQAEAIGPMGRLAANETQAVARPGAGVFGAPVRPERPSPDDSDRGRTPIGASAKVGSGVAFRAELDIAEIDTRGRPGVVWTGRAAELSRSQLAFRSRRMCYEGRELLVAVHLVDDRPVPLYGMVARSEYDGDGLYRTVIDLLPLPETDAIRNWVHNLHHKPTF